MSSEFYYTLIIVGLVVAFVVARAILTHFECPNCGKKFRMGVLKFTFASHFMSKRMAKCPYCGHKDMLDTKWGRK